MPCHSFNRRRFLAAAAATSVAAPLLNSSAGAQDDAQDDATPLHELCVFTKPFNSLTFDELADRIAELGFNGIEAPIRPGGHIETAAIADELPKLVEALAKRDLNITLITSDINDPSDPMTETFLRTMATLGVKRYRMKYMKYDLSQPIAPQLADWKPQLRDLAAMNHEFGVQGLYQNHAGAKYLGASLWDILEVLEGIPPADLGIAYDIRHATVEGATSWPVTFNMVVPHMAMVYVKDFQWGEEKVLNVPLGEGRVDAKFFELLTETGYAGPISLHEEYLDHKDPALVPKHLDAIKKDLAVLKKWLS